MKIQDFMLVVSNARVSDEKVVAVFWAMLQNPNLTDRDAERVVDLLLEFRPGAAASIGIARLMAIYAGRSSLAR